MPSAPEAFRGKTAIITGGASGIGRALAEALARYGAHVTIADRQGDLAAKVAADIRTAGGKAESVALDVTDIQSTQEAFQAAARRTGTLDYAFVNAGIWMMGDIDAFSLDDWTRLMDVNLRGAIYCTMAAYTIMCQQQSGHIVTTASVAGLTPDPGCTAYATTKHAIVGLSKSLRIEAAQHNVRVSVLCPGVVETPLLSGGGLYGKVLDEVEPEKMRKMWKSMSPMPVTAFATRALQDVANNRFISVWPWQGRLFWWLDRLSPALSLYLARRMYETNQRTMGLG